MAVLGNVLLDAFIVSGTTQSYHLGGHVENVKSRSAKSVILRNVRLAEELFESLLLASEV